MGQAGPTVRGACNSAHKAGIVSQALAQAVTLTGCRRQFGEGLPASDRARATYTQQSCCTDLQEPRRRCRGSFAAFQHEGVTKVLQDVNNRRKSSTTLPNSRHTPGTSQRHVRHQDM
jgi:hypothetical protein